MTDDQRDQVKDVSELDMVDGNPGGTPDGAASWQADKSVYKSLDVRPRHNPLRGLSEEAQENAIKAGFEEKIRDLEQRKAAEGANSGEQGDSVDDQVQEPGGLVKSRTKQEEPQGADAGVGRLGGALAAMREKNKRL